MRRAQVAEMEDFFTALTALTDLVNAGNAGLSAVQRLVEFTQERLDAVGASFAEYGAAGGRVIAASGASTWAIGRLVDPGEQEIARLMGRGRVIEVDIDEMPAELAAYLRGQGIRRMLGARAELAGRVVGSLHCYFRTGRPAGPERRSMIGFLGAVASHLYADGRGLPVYANDPSTSLAEAIVVIGPDHTVRSWNPAAASVTGWPATETVGRPSPVPVPGLGQVLDHRLPDGRWLQLLATQLPESPDRLITMRDVTEAHRREQARDLFVAVTSHELRTPVTVIKGYADTLGNHWDELGEGGRRDAVRRLGQRAGDLARLLERLLNAVGDGSTLAGTAVCVPFDLGEALRTAVAELPAENRRRVRMDLPDALPKALGERSSIAAILSELVTNAVKYAGPDSPIELSTIADPRSVGFRVADRGIGLRPEHVERAFERFWQAESGDQRRYGGVGLGLYLVRRMIERQNGWVSLRPRERGGTVAEVRLPRADLGPGEA
jgi:signal transduction histidine kinase